MSQPGGPGGPEGRLLDWIKERLGEVRGVPPAPRPRFVPVALAERMDRAKASGHVAQMHFAEWDEAGQIVAIHCKGCGRKIKGLRPMGNPEVVRVEDDQRTRLLIQKVQMGPLADYVEVVVEMEDGARHETHACLGCLPKLNTPEGLEAFFMADLEVMAEEFRRGGGDGAAHGRYLDFLGKKRPVRWRQKVPLD